MRIYLILFVALISVSSTALVIRHVEFVPALTLAFWRMFSASIILLLYQQIKPKKTITNRNKKRIMYAGIFLGLHFAFFFLGVRNTSISSATLLANTGPVFTAIIAIINKESLSKYVFYGLIVTTLGILIVQKSIFEFGLLNNYATILSLLSGFCIAVTYVFASKIRKDTDNTIYGMYVFFIASITIFFVTLLTGDSLLEFERSHIMWFLFLGLVPSILGHNMLNYCIKYLSPTAIASVPLGEPIIASLLGFFLFYEKISINAIFGAPFIFIGIYIIIKNSNTN